MNKFRSDLPPVLHPQAVLLHCALILDSFKRNKHVEKREVKIRTKPENSLPDNMRSFHVNANSPLSGREELALGNEAMLRTDSFIGQIQLNKLLLNI